MASRSAHRSANVIVAEQLKRNAAELEKAMNAHVLTWWGPIQPPVDHFIRQAVEHRKKEGPQRTRLAMVLQTPGGYIETAERIANTLRKHYRWIAFIIPDLAMSAGTVLVMSGDEIWMNYFSRLGPIDPQVERSEGKKGLIPALGYLEKYKDFIDKSSRDELTPVEGAYSSKISTWLNCTATNRVEAFPSICSRSGWLNISSRTGNEPRLIVER